MDVSIIIVQTISHRPVGWSVGNCDRCGQLEAMRREDKVETTWLWLFPVSKEVLGRIARCQFCRTQAAIPPVIPTVGYNQWSPNLGLKALLDLLRLDYQTPRPATSTRRLNSFLSALHDQTSVNNYEVSRGMTSGLIIGAIVLPPTTVILRYSGFLELRADDLGLVMLSVVVGAIGGMVVGAALQVLIGTRQLVRERVEEVLQDGSVSPSWLQELSNEYRAVVRAGVRRGCFAARKRRAPAQHDDED